MARGTRLKALALLPALALTGGISLACGAGGDGSGGTKDAPASAGSSNAAAIPAASKDDKLAGMVPDAVKSDGKIVFGQDQSYPPNEFVDEKGTVVGFDVDLGTAVTQKLGLKAEFQNAAFDGIITGLSARKYELAMSSFTINADRLKTVDMVSYYKAGTSLGVLKGNPDKIAVDDLCGKNVAVQKGTTQVEDLDKRTAQCTGAGKPAINVTQLQAQTDVNLALTSKRAQAMLADSPVVDYAVKQTGGQLEVVGQPYDSAPYGIAVTKGNGQLSQAVQQALQALIDDGTYKKILEKWGLNPVGVIAKSEVNPQP